MTACVSCWLYLIRDAMKNLISRETENFPTHREVNTGNTLWHDIPFIIYLIDLMLNKTRENTISANCIKKSQNKFYENLGKGA